ncbi:MAG TPA: ABC transporter permease [Vicinamibacterales bacterium]|nr:ABC transporter permease [Vicinamibacterales bacterium]
MIRLLRDLTRDVRYGGRVLFRNPLFAAVAVASLSLGIGGATSVFTVMNAVLLRMLPVPDPHELYAVTKVLGPERQYNQYAWPAFERARNEVAGRAELAAFISTTTMQVRPDAGAYTAADRAMVQLVSGEYFPVLRQQPQAGRLLQPTDNVTVDGHPVAVISDTFWEQHFRRSPAAVGKQMIVNGASLTIVGVTAPDFFGPIVSYRNPDVWVPLMMQAAVRYASNASNSGTADPRKPWAPQNGIEWLSVIARVPEPANVGALASVLTLHHQRDALADLTPQSSEDDRRRISTQTVRLEPANRGISPLRQNLGGPLAALLGMVGVLLVIACGNLASLLLSRANAREREMAIRLSIGASRARVIRQLLAETLLLSVIGGGLGLLIAAWGRDLLLTMFSGSAIIDLDTAFDWRVLAFAFAVTLVTGVAAGVGPALRGTRVSLAEGIKTQSRSVGAGRRGALVGKSLVAAQIAFCLLLLVIAALFTRSMESLLRIDVGYDRDALLVARMDVRSVGYSPEERQALYRRLLERVEAIPGVVSASASLNGPMGTSRRISSLTIEGYTPQPDEQLLTFEEIVTDGYFDTVGLRILEGRHLTAADAAPGARTTVINQAMAKRFFPAGGAIGKRWTYGDLIGPESRVIVGVVEDATYLDVRRALPNMAYHLSGATPEDVLSNLEVRTSLPPSQLVATVKKVLSEAEPALPVYDIVPLEVRLNRGISNDRLIARLTTTFSVVALLLACLGLYGTISYGVTQRVTELGVRMALGAARSDVLWLVIREAAILVAAGVLVGIPLAYLAGRSVTSLLYGVRAMDVASYGVAIAALFAVAGFAAFLPAHRASRIDPMVALRKE